MKQKKPKQYKVEYYKAIRAVSMWEFPLDMLRYDHAYVPPETIQKVTDGEFGSWWEAVKGLQGVVLAVVIPRGYGNKVAHQRWLSFGWRLEKTEYRDGIHPSWVTMQHGNHPVDELEPVTFQKWLDKK